MASIVKQKVGKHIYLYESFSYRDENGEPRNKRKPIGKINLKTGLPVFKTEYLERTGNIIASIESSGSQKGFDVDDIQNSNVLSVGTYHLFHKIAEQIGLLPLLKEVFPSKWKEVFNLACYLVSEGEPLLYCEDWISNTECLPSGSMSSQRLSELLQGITNKECVSFFDKWGTFRAENEYLALDITSISFYSSLIDDVEWGYNRDGENLPQINMCLLMGENSRLPVFETVYSGSLNDVSTLKATIPYLRDDIMLVMDKGFCSKKNISDMLSNNIRFVISSPFSLKVVRQQIDAVRNEIDSLKNTLLCGSDTMRGITTTCRWNDEHQVFIHVYYNPVKAAKERDELFGYLTSLVEKARENPVNPKYLKEFDRYLYIKKDDKGFFEITVRHDIVNKELENKGWMVLVSNDIDDIKKAIHIYRTKDVVEKGFYQVKNALDLGCLRVHRVY